MGHGLMVALPVLSARQEGHARTIITVCQGLIPDPVSARLAAVYAIACSLAEASLTNWENGGTATQVGRAEGRQLTDAERAVARQSCGLGDGVPPWGDNLDSMGLFAQRPMSGWGPPRELMRPSVATSKFLLGPAGRSGLLGRKDWATAPFATVIAKVQGYYDPAIYADARLLAEATVDRLWPTTAPKEPDVATKEETEAAAKSAAAPIPARSAAEVWDAPITLADGKTATARDTLAGILGAAYQLLKGRVVGRATIGTARVELDIEAGTYRVYPSPEAYDARSVQLTEQGIAIREFGEIDPAAQGWVEA